jgi:hypothetical protein
MCSGLSEERWHAELEARAGHHASPELVRLGPPNVKRSAVTGTHAHPDLDPCRPDHLRGHDGRLTAAMRWPGIAGSLGELPVGPADGRRLGIVRRKGDGAA